MVYRRNRATKPAKITKSSRNNYRFALDDFHLPSSTKLKSHSITQKTTPSHRYPIYSMTSSSTQQLSSYSDKTTQTNVNNNDVNTNKHHYYTLLTLLSSFALIALGLFSLHQWVTKSAFMSYPGRIPQGINPFDVKSVVFLTIFMLAGPIGFMLLFHSVLVLLRFFASKSSLHYQINGFNVTDNVFIDKNTQKQQDIEKKHQNSTKIKLFLYLTTILITIAISSTLSYYSYIWTQSILQCGFIWCFDESKYPDPIEMTESKGAMGFKSTISAPFIITLTFISICLLFMGFREVYYYCQDKKKNSKSSHKKQDEMTQSLLLNTVDSGDENNTLTQSTSTSTTSSTQALINANNTSTSTSTLTKTTSYTPYNTYFQVDNNNIKYGNDIQGQNDNNNDNVANHSKKDQNSLSKTPKTQKTPLLRQLTYLLLTLILFSFFFIISSYLPGSFRHYWPGTIAARAAMKVSRDSVDCSVKGAFSCPEMENSFFHTISVSISPHLILKLFPSNVIFYSFIAMALLFPFIARLNTKIDNFLQKKIKINTPTIIFWNYARRKSLLSLTPVYMSLYELLLSFWLALGCALFFLYWAHDHNFKSRWPKTEGGMAFWDAVYRSFGQLAVIILSLLMFPVARTSPLLQILGISWDKGISFHRWAGVGFMIMTIVHMITSYIAFYKRGGWAGVLELIWSFPPFTYLDNRDNFTIPLLNAIMLFSFITIGVIAFYEPIRRAKYDLFLITHHLTYILLIPATIWHAAAAWEYLIPALSLYISDRIIRVYRGSKAFKLNDTSIGQFRMQNDRKITKSGPNGPNGPNDVNINKNSPFSPHSINFHLPPQKPITSIHSSRTTTISDVISNENAAPGVRLIDYGKAGRFIELKIDNKDQRFVFFPGHYTFINIAEVSLFEWHPMTISGHCHAKSNELSFMIKCEGASGTWTNNLWDYIKVCTDKQIKKITENQQNDQNGQKSPLIDHFLLDIPLTISLDGPYGGVVDFNRYDNIILVAGGAGVTPVKSIFNSLYLSFLHDFVPNSPHNTLLHKQITAQLDKTQLMNKNINQCHGEDVENSPQYDDDVKKNGPNGVNVEENSIILPKKVHLFFASRDASLFNSMSDSLCHIPKGDGMPFSVELICSNNGQLVPIQSDLFDENGENGQNLSKNTQNGQNLTTVPHIISHHLSTQRQGDVELESSTPLECSIKKALGVDSLKNVKEPEKTLLFACGPFRLTEQAKEIAVMYGFHQHEEQFEL